MISLKFVTEQEVERIIDFKFMMLNSVQFRKFENPKLENSSFHSRCA
jgi:hypothetical protein